MVVSLTASRYLMLALFLVAIELFLLTFNMQTIRLLELDYLQLWQLPLGYVDLIGKLLLIAVFVWLLLSQKRLARYRDYLVAHFEVPRFKRLALVQVLSFLLVLMVSQPLFNVDQPLAAASFHWLSVLWLMALTLAVVTIPLCLSRVQGWSRWLEVERSRLLITMLVTLVFWKFAKWTQSVWGNFAGDGLAAATFDVVAWLLGLFVHAPVAVNLAERVIGIGEFSVYIAPECSGYEGMGLVIAALATYLGLYRKDFRFPRVLLLVPLGLALVWMLNCVRIAALVLIGHYWSPEIAVGGFHSQAGWLSFIATAVLLLWLANNSPWLQRRPPSDAVPLSHSAVATHSMGTAEAMLIPLVVLLAVTLVTTALVAKFDYWYPLRVVVVAIALVKVWPVLGMTRFRVGWQAWVGGLLVSLLWVLFHGDNPEANQAFTQGLESMPPLLAVTWLLFRVVGASVTVPIAEELAFRGYLYAKLAGIEVRPLGPVPFHWLAVALSSLAFGALHGAWVAGTLAGLVYAWVRIRSNQIGDAIVAHAVTNLIIAGYGMATGNWWLL